MLRRTIGDGDCDGDGDDDDGDWIDDVAAVEDEEKPIKRVKREDGAGDILALAVAMAGGGSVHGMPHVGMPGVTMADIGMQSAAMHSAAMQSAAIQSAAMAGLGLQRVGMPGMGMAGMGMHNAGVHSVAMASIGLQGMGMAGIGMHGAAIQGVAMAGLGLPRIGSPGMAGMGMAGMGMAGIGMGGFGVPGMGVPSVGMAGMGVGVGSGANAGPPVVVRDAAKKRRERGDRDYTPTTDPEKIERISRRGVPKGKAPNPNRKTMADFSGDNVCSKPGCGIVFPPHKSFRPHGGHGASFKTDCRCGSTTYKRAADLKVPAV